MKRIIYLSTALVVLVCGIVLGIIGSAVYASSATLSTETPAPPSIVCYIDDTRYVLNQFVDVTPTRITVPSVTPLPTATATPPACVTRTILGAVNVRAGAGTSFAIVSGLKAGAVVSVAEFRTIATGGVWARLCGTQTWFSATSAGVSQ